MAVIAHGNRGIREFGAVPRQFEAKEIFGAAATRATPRVCFRPAPTSTLHGTEALIAAMRVHDLAIAEESQADELLQDWAR